MANSLSQPTSFDRAGPTLAAGPIVIAVPHAGRIYPPALIANARLPRSRLQALEDRLVDRVLSEAAIVDATQFVARHARAWIDLNRDPRELDPEMIAPAPGKTDVIATAKVRGGLGLIPRRVAGSGDINARKLSMADIEARIASDHEPYHGAIAEQLAATRARFGIALLVDCHSMPAIPPGAGGGAPRVVIGDRFGKSADARFTDLAMAIGEAAGFAPALNAPYAGGYTLDRHGRPAEGIHALQIEIDRSLYLDAALETAGPGMARVARWLRTLVMALAQACRDDGRAMAAE
jgi:N-formylglutamate amidohydrolase